MRCGDNGPNIRMNFRCHQAFFALTKTDKHHLSGPQLHHSEAAQRFHMDENIFGTLTSCKKAKPLCTVEPFNDHSFQTARRGNLYVSALWWQLGRMNSG